MQERIKNTMNKHREMIQWLSMYVILYVIIESLQRSSIIKGIGFIFEHPLISIYNIALIAILSSFIIVFKKKKVAFMVYGLIWVGLSCTSGIKADFRGDPLMAQDFFLMKEAGGVASAYLSTGKIFMIALIIISAIILIVYTSKKEKMKINRRFAKKSIIIAIISGIVVFPFISKVSLSIMKMQPIRWDMKASYFNYGFAYSFAETISSLKPEKPDDYSKDKIEDIKEDINTIVASSKNDDIDADIVDTQIKPNVIGFLLEAFFDPTTLPGVTFSRDPIPNFRKLQSMYSTGLMDVQVIGGGTVNTEFEVFTSMDIGLLPPGNTPYVQTLNKKSIESMPGVFKKNGYTTTAIHDHYGNFYNRVDVYKNLGFDRFISGETLAYKNKVGGWTEDKIMLEPIRTVLNSQNGGNFIFGITVQTHGPYDGTTLISEDCPRVTSDVLSEEEKIQLENYAYQIEQTDKFIGDVIDIINESGQPTLMFMYGDHLPALGDNFSVFDKTGFTAEQKYQTPYLIWDNMGIEKKDEDLKSYELATKIFGDLKMDGTEMSKLQIENKLGQATEEDFKLLQYDILYGKEYIYDEEDSFRVDDMKIGLEPLAINSIQIVGDTAIIKGTGFTEQSSILNDNKVIDTKFIDVNTVEIPSKKIKSGDSIAACYIGLNNGTYGKSEEFTIN